MDCLNATNHKFHVESWKHRAVVDRKRDAEESAKKLKKAELVKRQEGRKRQEDAPKEEEESGPKWKPFGSVGESSPKVPPNLMEKVIFLVPPNLMEKVGITVRFDHILRQHALCFMLYAVLCLVLCIFCLSYII